MPDDIASIFADMWRNFLAAPLWMKPFVAVSMLFGAGYHLLSLARIYGMVLVIAVFVFMVPVGLVLAAAKAALWVLAIAGHATG